MDDTLTPHEQRARRAVQYERERAHHRAAEAWLDVSRLAPNDTWRQWALLRANICLQRT